MSGRRIAAAAAWLVMAVSSAAGAADRPQPLPDQKADMVSEALKPCPSALERFLPGDYYYCDAARAFWQGRDGAAREALKDAAAWANKPAQYALGIMYFNGDHAEKNRALGLAWLGLAVERHDPQYEATFKDAYARVSSEELAQANAYWKQMREKYADNVAAVRAKNRFDRAYGDLSWAINFGGSVFIDGIAGLQMTDGIASGDATYGASGFSVGRFLQGRKAVALAGWQENVTVGDPTLVPISEVVKRQ